MEIVIKKMGNLQVNLKRQLLSETQLYLLNLNLYFFFIKKRLIHRYLSTENA